MDKTVRLKVGGVWVTLKGPVIPRNEAHPSAVAAAQRLGRQLVSAFKKGPGYYCNDRLRISNKSEVVAREVERAAKDKSRDIDDIASEWTNEFTNAWRAAGSEVDVGDAGHDALVRGYATDIAGTLGISPERMP